MPAAPSRFSKRSTYINGDTMYQKNGSTHGIALTCFVTSGFKGGHNKALLLFDDFFHSESCFVCIHVFNIYPFS